MDMKEGQEILQEKNFDNLLLSYKFTIKILKLGLDDTPPTPAAAVFCCNQI